MKQDAFSTAISLVTFSVTLLAASGGDAGPASRPGDTGPVLPRLQFREEDGTFADPSYAAEGAVFSPDGRTIYCIGGARSGFGTTGAMTIWRPERGKPEVVKMGGDFTSLAISHDGSMLAAAPYGLGLCLVRPDAKRRLQWVNHKAAITQLLGFLPDDKGVLIVEDRRIKVLPVVADADPAQVPEVAATVGVCAAALSSDGSSLLTIDSEGRLRLLRTSAWSERQQVALPFRAVASACLSGDGQRAFVAPSRAESGKDTPEPLIIDFREGKTPIRVRGWQAAPGSTAAFLDDQHLLAIAGDLYDTTSGEQVGADPKAPPANAGADGRSRTMASDWRQIANSPDGRSVVACTAGGAVRLFNLVRDSRPAGGVWAMEMALSEKAKRQFDGGLYINMQWSADASRIYLVGVPTDLGDQQVRLTIWNWREGSVNSVDFQGEYPTVAASHDGKVLALGTVTKEGKEGVRLLDPATGAVSRVIEAQRCNWLGFSNDDRLLLLDGEGLASYDLPTGKVSRPLKKQGAEIKAAALNSDGTILAVQNEEGVLSTWRVDGWNAIGEFPTHMRGSFTDRLSLSPHGDKVFYHRFSILTKSAGVVVDLTADSTRTLRGQHNDEPFDGVFSPDGTIIVANMIFDAATGQGVRAPWSLSSFARFSPDSRLLASTDGQSVSIWTVGEESNTK